MKIGVDIVDLQYFPSFEQGLEKRFFKDNFTKNDKYLRETFYISVYLRNVVKT